ncbi:MAG: hypothetical protein RSE41_00160 [Clostridia bacterium]
MKRNRKDAAIKRKIVKAIGQPWDWIYMLELEKAKLETMLSYFNQSHIVEDENIIIRDIKLAISLIDIIIDDGMSNTSFENGEFQDNNKVNLRNANRFMPSLNITGFVCAKGYVKTEKAWHLYNKLRLYKMRNWWD